MREKLEPHIAHKLTVMPYTDRNEGEKFGYINLTVECQDCNEVLVSADDFDDFGPTRNGSSRCESGSIASGGTKTFCTCDTCF